MSEDSGISPEAEEWVTNVYAKAIAEIALKLREEGVSQPNRVAGEILARLARLDPPLTVERLQ
jgi:hypothetical protein